MHVRPHVQHAERSAHARWHVDVVDIKGNAGAAICSLSICKLAAVKMNISHIASKARGLRGMLTHFTFALVLVCCLLSISTIAT